MQDDAVTVITTIHNGDACLARYCANLVQTLRAQDHAVIVDDGSDIPFALSPDLIDDPRIETLFPGRIGRGAALNLAIAQAGTGLIAIQDVDDISLPGRLARQSALLRHRPDTLLFARAETDRRTIFARRQFPVTARRLYRGNPLHHSSLAFHRTVWERVGGYDPDLPCCIDLDFYLRAALRGQSTLLRLPDVLIRRNFDPATRWFTGIPDREYQRTRHRILERHRPELRRKNPILSRLSSGGWGCGWGWR